MPRYTDVDLLLENIKDGVVFTVRDKNSPELRGARKIINKIKNAPTADVVEVKRGEWIYNIDDFTPKMRCSICGYNKPLASGENIEQEPNYFCNNCGAKMG